MFWLDMDPRPVQEQELGSRYEHSSRKAGLDVFEERMVPVARSLATVLKPSKLAFIFVGDSVLDGQLINMKTVYERLLEPEGLVLLDSIAYDLMPVSHAFRELRASSNGHKHTKQSHVLVFEKRNRSAVKRGSQRISATARASSDLSVKLDEAGHGDVVAIAADSGDRHVHALVGYPSKFLPDIPRWALTTYSRPGDLVADPFGGSGTTGVEAVLAGRNAISVDINPWATLSAKAKSTPVEPHALRRDVDLLTDYLREPSKLPQKARSRFELDDFWFDTEHLTQFARILELIDTQMQPRHSDFLRVVLGSTIRTFSRQDESQLKVKRDPRKVLTGTPSPADIMLRRLPAAVDRIIRFSERAHRQVSHRVVLGSADNFPQDRPTDLIVTSPPYINAMNYSMAARYEILLLGLVGPGSLIAHQTDYIGTERVYSRDYSQLQQFPTDQVLAEPLNPLLEKIYESEPKRAFIVYNFFRRMGEGSWLRP